MTMRRAALTAIQAALLVAGLCGSAVAESVPQPDGYRLSDYKAPVPDGLTGATTVTTAEAKALHDTMADKDGTLFIDALPKPPTPKLAPGTVLNEKPRDDIPGSVWLPDVGYGELNAEMDGWFRAELSRLTAGDKARPMLFYCLAHCWMSWNAAKRALSYGYSRVIWYPGGSDGWAEAGLPLERREAEKRPFE